MSPEARRQEEVAALILAAIDDVNLQRFEGESISKSLDENLFAAGRLDSLGLVNLIVGVEEKVSDAFGVELNLADAGALPEAESPFRTLGALADFVTGLLEDTDGL